MRNLREKVFDAWKSGRSPSPATEKLGITILRLGRGQALLEMQVDERLHNLSGTMHGGIMGDIADADGNCVGHDPEAPGRLYHHGVQDELPPPHIRGVLRAQGSVAKKGRRVGFTEAVLTNSKREVVARSSGTCLLVKR